MKATIKGEDEEGCGLEVIDNNNAEHWIEIKYGSSEISYYESDGYPENDADCTQEQIELINQACRFARYHVYRERGYDVVPSLENPDRVLAAMVAVMGTSQAQIEALFGDLRQQLRSHFDGSEVTLPFEGVDPDETIIYEQEIYVQPDPVETIEDLDAQLEQRHDADISHSNGKGEAAFEQLVEERLPTDDTLFEIEAVSDLHYRHDDGYGNQQTHRPTSPRERPPDARLELLPTDPEELQSFHRYVIAHLGYQVRDCYLGMGLEPPEAFKVQGIGKYESSLNQRFLSVYDDYWNEEATIEFWKPNDIMNNQ